MARGDPQHGKSQSDMRQSSLAVSIIASLDASVLGRFFVALTESLGLYWKLSTSLVNQLNRSSSRYSLGTETTVSRDNVWVSFDGLFRFGRKLMMPSLLDLDRRGMLKKVDLSFWEAGRADLSLVINPIVAMVGIDGNGMCLAVEEMMTGKRGRSESIENADCRFDCWVVKLEAGCGAAVWSSLVILSVWNWWKQSQLMVQLFSFWQERERDDAKWTLAPCRNCLNERPKGIRKNWCWTPLTSHRN